MMDRARRIRAGARVARGVVTAALVVAAGAAAHPLEGQSLFSAAGLGLPSDAADGRAEALANAGIGLMGPSVVPTDPAALGLLTAPSAVFSSQPSWVDYDQDDPSASGSFQNTRFPLVGVAYPAWKLGMMSLTFGSVFDQRYQATRTVFVDLGDGLTEATDQFVSDGGVSRLDLNWGRSLTPNVAVGLSVGRYSGRVVRRLVRQFDEVDLDASAQPYQAGGRWSYTGTSVTGGASLQLPGAARLAVSMTRAGTLRAVASEDTKAGDAEYALPTTLRVGGSAILAPGLLLSGSFVRGDWSETAAELGEGAPAGAAKRIGVGLELTRAALLGRSTPLRLGYRTADLPFTLQGGGPASESAFTAGLGMVLNEQAGLILATADLALERGKRSDANLTERFWRATLSLRVAGF